MPHQLEWTPERVRRFWDYMSSTSDDYFTGAYGAAILDTLKRYLRGRGSVIDYGCGAGFLLEQLLERGWSATGADDSPESLEVVRARLSGRKGFGGAYSIDELLEKREQFDVVFSVEVIEHLEDEVLDSMLENCRALCAPRGSVILTTPNEERLEDDQVFCPACDSTFHRWQHVRSWSADSLERYLEARGFRVIDTLTVDLSVPAEKRRLRRWAKAWRHRRKPSQKQPHLLVVAQPEE